jgi:hypothetical protein
MAHREVQAECGDREDEGRSALRADDIDGAETADVAVLPPIRRLHITDPQKWLDLCA